MRNARYIIPDANAIMYTIEKVENVQTHCKHPIDGNSFARIWI